MNCSAIACVAHDPSVDNSPTSHLLPQHSTHCPYGQSAHDKKPARNRCVAVPSRLCGVCSVVSYSPAPWRVQYHRRCQA